MTEQIKSNGWEGWSTWMRRERGGGGEKPAERQVKEVLIGFNEQKKTSWMVWIIWKGSVDNLAFNFPFQTHLLCNYYIHFHFQFHIHFHASLPLSALRKSCFDFYIIVLFLFSLLLLLFFLNTAHAPSWLIACKIAYYYWNGTGFFLCAHEIDKTDKKS